MSGHEPMLHPSWSPATGFGLQVGRGRAVPAPVEGIRAHIDAARLVHGDEEADRLARELEKLLTIKASYERVQQGDEPCLNECGADRPQRSVTLAPMMRIGRVTSRVLAAMSRRLPLIPHRPGR